MGSGNSLTWAAVYAYTAGYRLRECPRGRTSTKNSDRNRVRCFACGHCCPIPEGPTWRLQGSLQPRRNSVRSWGYAGVSTVRPYRKEALFPCLSWGTGLQLRMLGCDLHCSYCQNWVTSQALRDPTAVGSPLGATPKRLCSKLFIKRPKVLVSLRTTSR